MILLQASNIAKSFGIDCILSNIDLTIQTGDKIGLVGVNGAGKSTLLKIITGQIPRDQGAVAKAPNISIGYLSQNTGLDSDKNIWEEMLTVFEKLLIQEQALRNLEQKMGDPALTANVKEYEKLLAEYDRLSEEFKTNGGYSCEAVIRGVLDGLGFQPEDYDSPIGILSGGQKTRLALARLLLGQPDLLILDEPTNYLDLQTMSWLEDFLKSYTGAFLVVSHDRYFLDATVNFIVEIENTRATKYTGNYTSYIEQKITAREALKKQYKKQQDEIARTKDFIQKNMARASTTNRAKSRLKALNRMDLLEAPEGDQDKLYLSFDIAKPSGNEVLQINDLAIGYPGLTLAQNITFGLEKGQRLALIGPNGTGKSTLLKTIIGLLPAVQGRIKLGRNVETGYYAQEQEQLSTGKTVLDELWDEYPLAEERFIRTVLGNFLFSQEDVYKPVANLSGGEKARLALAKLMLKQANLLILDEPTNHLDIYSREVLEESLTDFPGTILFVSHDRYFLNKIATGIIELSPQGTTGYLGNYDYYLFKKKEQTPDEHQAPAEKAKVQVDKQNYLMNKEMLREKRKKTRRLEELQGLIGTLETDIDQLNRQLCLPEIFQDHLACTNINNEIEQKKTLLDDCLAEWLELSETD